MVLSLKCGPPLQKIGKILIVGFLVHISNNVEIANTSKHIAAAKLMPAWQITQGVIEMAINCVNDNPLLLFSTVL